MIETHLPWTYDLDQAIRLQETLRQRLVLNWDDRPVNSVAGIDVSYSAISVYAAIAVFRYPDMLHLHTFTGTAPQDFPYVPSLLAYRAGPAILAAWEKLPDKPDLILIHGHGIAHPRQLGLASHIGLWVNTPSIGIAKTLLFGCPAEPAREVGAWSAILDEHNARRTIGASLRTRLGSKPVYVSPGHLIDLSHSIHFVLAASRGCRLPEPVRLAHQTASGIQQKQKQP
jgi:deoxyribonuclease V